MPRSLTNKENQSHDRLRPEDRDRDPDRAGRLAAPPELAAGRPTRSTTPGRSPASSWRPSRTRRSRTRSSTWRQTGAPIISDGEQRWSSFATYAITDTLAGTGLADHLAGDGGQYFAIFADGHNRQLPRLTGGPFRYKTYAADTLKKSHRRWRTSR